MISFSLTIAMQTLKDVIFDAPPYLFSLKDKMLEKAIDDQLNRLKLETLDLFLIQSPELLLHPLSKHVRLLINRHITFVSSLVV